MQRDEKSWSWGRIWVNTLGLVLGKSSKKYRQQFTGSDEYFRRGIAAQQGWPQKGLRAADKQSPSEV